jgi:hypothetical protein
MAQPQFTSLFLRLAGDKSLRRRFVEDPRGFLRSEGIDPDPFQFPERIDLDTLEQKIEEAFASQETNRTVPVTDVKGMTPDELWSRLGVILKRGGTENVTVDPVIVWPTFFGSNALETRLQQSIVKARKSDLSFSIKGPDGIAVEDLSASTVEALLQRLK